MLTCISPIDGSVYAERPTWSVEDAQAIASNARLAQARWAARPLAERTDLVRKGIDRVGEMNDDIVPELAWQMGRPVRYGGEFSGFAERWRYMAGIAKEALADIEMGSDADFDR